jgi:two-component system chemotaxis response regulator CheY
MSANVLVIDDAEHIRTMLQLTLEFEGHRVATAADGAEALAKARDDRFDLIFCDIDMPGMNGLEFVARYREHLDARTPIIMLTAEGGELIQKALAAGATAVVHKPFEPIRVLKEVEKYLGAEG